MFVQAVDKRFPALLISFKVFLVMVFLGGLGSGCLPKKPAQTVSDAQRAEQYIKTIEARPQPEVIGRIPENFVPVEPAEEREYKARYTTEVSRSFRVRPGYLEREGEPVLILSPQEWEKLKKGQLPKFENEEAYIKFMKARPQPEVIGRIPENFVPIQSDSESLTPLEDAISPRLGNSYNLKEPSSKTILGSEYPGSEAETSVDTPGPSTEQTMLYPTFKNEPGFKNGGLNVGLSGGFGQMEGTRFSIGGVTKGGEEQALAKNSKRVNTTFIGAQVSYGFGPKWGFSATRLNVGGRYLWGEEKDSAEEPMGGSPVFISYDKQASPMSFTGAGLGTTGAVARSENHVKGIDLNLGWSGDYITENGLIVSPNVTFSYKGLWQLGWGDVRSLTFGDAIRSETEQELDDHYYGIGTGFQLAKSCERSGMTVFMGGDITGYYRMTDLMSRQKNNCTTIGCTAANNHTARVTDADSGFTYGVEGRAGVALPLGQGWEVGGMGTVEYLDERGGIRNRENPNQDVKRIETDEALDWTAGLFVQKSF